MGPESYFAVRVRVDPIMQAPIPSRVTAGCVSFEPGARCASPFRNSSTASRSYGWRRSPTRSTSPVPARVSVERGRVEAEQQSLFVLVAEGFIARLNLVVARAEVLR